MKKICQEGWENRKENTGQRAEWQVLVLTQTASLAGPQLQATAQQAYTVGHMQPWWNGQGWGKGGWVVSRSCGCCGVWGELGAAGLWWWGPAAVCSCVCGHRQCHSCAALQQVSAVHELHQPWEGISPEVSILCQLFSPLVAYLMQEKSKEKLAQQISKLPLTCSPEGFCPCLDPSHDIQRWWLLACCAEGCWWLPPGLSLSPLCVFIILTFEGNNI